MSERKEDEFARRCDEFFAGLRELAKRTGVALATSPALGAWGEMQMVDARDGIRSDYLREGPCISWHRGGDYVDDEAMPENQERKR